MKIAVVGSGISGMAAAHYLSRTHEVHLFEQDGRLGGHTHTVDVDGVPVDTGFIVFNDWTYPNLIRLLDALGVASQPSDMSFSVKAEADGMEYNGTSVDALFAQRVNVLRPQFWGMIRDIVRFNRAGAADADRLPPQVTLGEYLDRGGYGRFFRERYVVPMGAAIWSSPAAAMEGFPAAFFLRFFKNHGMLSVDRRPQWRTVRGGSRSYVEPLCRPFKERIHMNARVTALRRLSDGVALTVDGAEFRADHAVLAGHADQMLGLLADPTPAEREVLGALPYQENVALLHTDASVMPARRRAWAAWNYWLPASPAARPAVTYWMNKLQSLETPRPVFVSLNMEDRVDPARVLKKIVYHHPLFTRAGVAAQGRWGEISGGRTHYCGAYWRNGFHEDGLWSALRVCEALGVRP